ncbi:MAG: hypothetical protein OXF41_02765 [bacterium]|nr:hypothetical protein [bacterium]
MGRSRVNEIGGSQLMDVPQSLHGYGVDHSPLVGISTDEGMNWIAELVLLFDHQDPGVERMFAQARRTGM